MKFTLQNPHQQRVIPSSSLQNQNSIEVPERPFSTLRSLNRFERKSKSRKVIHYMSPHLHGESPMRHNRAIGTPNDSSHSIVEKGSSSVGSLTHGEVNFMKNY